MSKVTKFKKVSTKGLLLLRWFNTLSINNKIAFFRLVPIFFTLLGITIFSTFFTSPTYADNLAVSEITLDVLPACTISVTGNEHMANISAGSVKNVGDASTFTISCNDQDGYVVYAVGDSNDEEGNNALIGTNNNQIATGLNTEGNTSSWFFQLSNAKGLTINSGFTENALIPNSRQAVATRTSGTSLSEGDSFTANYSAYISPTQVADSYSGKVKYILFHPNTHGPEDDSVQPMQNWQGCGALTQDDGSNSEFKYTSLVDSRDGNEYKVAKLKDGNCWMTENLRLGDEKLIDRNIKAEDSDFNSGDVTDGIINIPTSTNSDWNDTTYNKSMFYSDSNPEHGGLYTWYLATAEEGTNSKNSGDMSRSICPKGWRLPTSQEIITLTQSYNRSQAQTGVPNLGSTTWTGYCNQNGCPVSQGSYGGWWSSTPLNTSNAYFLYSGSVEFTFRPNTKGFGLSVRCIARESNKITDLQYLQDWDNLSEKEKKQITDLMDKTQSYQLTDKRDGNTYNIAKLADGKVWMTDNLRLGDEKLTDRNIKAEDSDFDTSSVPSGTINIPEPTNTGWDFSTYDKSMVYIDSTYGGYYTWYLATAEEGTGSFSETTSRSICPKGWSLPTVRNVSTLTNYYNLTTSQEAPANFIPAGQCNNIGCPSEQGFTGAWWLSVADNYSTGNAYYISSASSGFMLGNTAKGVGHSVRCVAQ